MTDNRAYAVGEVVRLQAKAAVLQAGLAAQPGDPDRECFVAAGVVEWMRALAPATLRQQTLGVIKADSIHSPAAATVKESQVTNAGQGGGSLP